MGFIRFLLAFSVVIAHCGTIFGLHLVSSETAVQSFYIISGFYMSLILNEKYIGSNNSFTLFLTNRLLRLYPIYWVVLLGTILACFMAGFVSHGDSFGRFDSYFLVKTNICSLAYLIGTNIFIFGQDVVMFLGIIPESGNLFFTNNFWLTKPQLWSFLFVPQAWTLGVELTFYLVAPFIVKKSIKIIAPIIITSFLLRLYIYDYLGLKNDPWTYRFFPTEIMFFLFGYLSYRIYLKIKMVTIPKFLNIVTLTFILIFTFVYPYLTNAKMDWIPFAFKDIFYFLSIIISIPILFNFLRKNKFDNQIGELSYPVYISHILIFYVCSNLPFDFLKSGTLIAFFTLIFSILLNKYVALPIEKFRQSRIKV